MVENSRRKVTRGLGVRARAAIACLFSSRTGLPGETPWRFIGGTKPVDKSKLRSAIIARLRADVELYSKAARAARAEATDEQSKAENKYDTRGLEASYLARGQSRQVAQTEAALDQLEKMPLRDFKVDDPIDLGAVVELAAKRERTAYFIAPCAGGTEVNHDEADLLVLTPQSPLGQQLMGRKQGERLQLELGGMRQEYRVLAVR